MEPENRDALRELQALKHKFKEHDRMAEKPSTLTPTPTRTRTLTLTATPILTLTRCALLQLLPVSARCSWPATVGSPLS